MIVLDASILISHLVADRHAERALEIVDTEEDLGLHRTTLAECLVGPVRVGREAEAITTFERLGIEPLGWHEDEPLLLARLRAQTRLRIPDCCVLAGTLLAGATLATFDRRLAEAAAGHGVAVIGV